MSADREVTRIVRSWLDEGATALPDRVLDAVLDQVPATSQRRPLWPVRRYREMNTALKVAFATVAVVVVALVGITLLPRTGGVGTGPGPTATPIATPTQTGAPTQRQTAAPSASEVPAVFPESPLAAGTYTVAPFSAGEGMCFAPPQTGCTETPADDTIRVSITVPGGWSGIGSGIWLTDQGNGAPDGAGLTFGRGAWLLADPCKGPLDVRVGPSVDDFVDAVAAHPILDTTPPVDVTLAGYSGRYFDLQVPSDVADDGAFNPTCPVYRPWEPGLFAQGPSQRWHQWVLDVDGVRVVVQSFDYAGTSAEHRAELEAILESIKIES